MEHALLEVDEVSVAFRHEGVSREVVSRLSFTIQPGQILGMVGESGSGKSVAALAIMRLLGAQGAITHGVIRFDGEDITALPEAAMRRLRGRRIGMIFQEPMTSLNPLFTIGFQVSEVLREHLGLGLRAAHKIAAARLEEVGITASERFDDYPHQLSGGMRQRVMIAMAMACAPRLLIADEPTTSLDVTVQAQILDVMLKLRRQHGSAVMLITHDMGVIARMAGHMVVMYAGEVVEIGPLRELFARPAHPYTKLLLAATPTARRKLASLPVIPGSMPSPGSLPSGCRFHPRCPFALAKCRETLPPMRPIGIGRSARCWRAEDLLAGAAA